MSDIKHQKGFIQLGIIGLIVLVAGLFVTTKLASNPNLTFFNIAEKAAGTKCEEYDEGSCGSKCSPAGYTCQWKKRECKTSSKKCEGKSGSTSESQDSKTTGCEATPGQKCQTNCDGNQGWVNTGGACGNKEVCCTKAEKTPVPTKEPTPTPTETSKPTNTSTPRPTPTKTPSPKPTPVPSQLHTPTPTLTATKVPTPTPYKLVIPTPNTNRTFAPQSSPAGTIKPYVAREYRECGLSGLVVYNIKTYNTGGQEKTVAAFCSWQGCSGGVCKNAPKFPLWANCYNDLQCETGNCEGESTFNLYTGMCR